MSTKRPFSHLTQKEKAIELLRWIAVLPAAMLGRMVMRLLVVVLVYAATLGSWTAPDEWELIYILLLPIFYCPKEAAFVIAGAKMAPRGRLATAIVLSTIATLMSLFTHILVQNNPGITNYTHFGLETAGAVAGIVCIYLSEAKLRHQSGSSC